ncbi:MAG: alkaline shock response membrane anchor protein AmaP [Actinomycetota bacterium]|nr:alkaline shock response membrane anchor protein AmaP [Actinomycetota bacterium]
MHADRTNRVVLATLALLALATGVLGTLLSFGVFGTSAQRTSLLDNPVSVFIGDNSAWFWPVAAILGLVLVALGLRWLLILSFSTDRVGNLVVGGDRSGGRSTLSSSALTTAVADEIEGYSGVHSVKSRIIGHADAPELVLDVVLEDSADLAAIRHRIETESIAHTRQALDSPHLPVIVDLTVTNKQQKRVA